MQSVIRHLAIVGLLVSSAHADMAYPEKVKACRTQAEACATSLVKGQYDKLIACTLPKVVQMIGGPAKMSEVLVSGRIKMRAQGFEIVSATASDPKQTLGYNGILYAIVPTAVIIKTPQGKVRQPSYFIGVSNDGGANWKFIDGANVDEQKLRVVLPDFPVSMKLPDPEEPTPVTK
jgi:hypothetical protein